MCRGRALNKLIRPDPVREVAVDEVELGAGIGLRPLAEVGGDDRGCLGRRVDGLGEGDGSGGLGALGSSANNATGGGEARGLDDALVTVEKFAGNVEAVGCK